MKRLFDFTILFYISVLLCLVIISVLTDADPTATDQCSAVSEQLAIEMQKNQELYHQVVFSAETIKKQMAEIDMLNEKAKDANEYTNIISSKLSALSEKYEEILNKQDSMNTKLKEISDILMIPMIYKFDEPMEQPQDFSLLEKIHNEVSQLKLDYIYEIEASESNIKKIEALEKKLEMSSAPQESSEINFVKDLFETYHIMKPIYIKFFNFLTFFITQKYYYNYQVYCEQYLDKVKEMIRSNPHFPKIQKFIMHTTNVLKKVYFDLFHTNICSFSTFVNNQMRLKLSTTNHIIEMFNKDINNFLEKFSQKYNMTNINYPSDIYNKTIMMIIIVSFTYFGFKFAFLLFNIIFKVIGMLFRTMFPTLKKPKQKKSANQKPRKSSDQPNTHFKPSSNLSDFSKLSPVSNESKYNAMHKKNQNKKASQH